MRWETDFGAAELSQLNLYDRTVEGLVLKDVPASTVQYHPEAGPGPHDACTCSTVSWRGGRVEIESTVDRTVDRNNPVRPKPCRLSTVDCRRCPSAPTSTRSS